MLAQSDCMLAKDQLKSYQMLFSPAFYLKWFLRLAARGKKRQLFFGKNVFFLLTFDRHHHVPLVKARRNMYLVTLKGQVKI